MVNISKEKNPENNKKQPKQKDIPPKSLVTIYRALLLK